MTILLLLGIWLIGFLCLLFGFMACMLENHIKLDRVKVGGWCAIFAIWPLFSICVAMLMFLDYLFPIIKRPG